MFVIIYYVILYCSSFSIWVKNCEALSLPDDQREDLNSLIDSLYTDIDEGLSQVLQIYVSVSADRQ
jgi:hypothetical protein